MKEEIKSQFIQLGQNIKTMREEKKITIQEISEKTGIRVEYLKKIENGTAYGILIDKHLSRIANALRVKLSELFVSLW